MGMTRGEYQGVNGTTFETYIGRGDGSGANGQVSCRWAWKVPHGQNEVKVFPTCIFGAKPGHYSEGATPGGWTVNLPDGSDSTKAPSGETPGTFLPMQATGSLPPIRADVSYVRKEQPTGKGQLTFDMWLQAVPQQINGFNASPLTHEIMIPLDNWGGYGTYPDNRNPGWYQHDVELEGFLWHVYMAENFSSGGWTFVVFEPDGHVNNVTLNLSTFINYVHEQGWASGSEHLIDIELGVEAIEETGDVQLNNYRVYK